MPPQFTFPPNHSQLTLGIPESIHRHLRLLTAEVFEILDLFKLCMKLYQALVQLDLRVRGASAANCNTKAIQHNLLRL